MKASGLYNPTAFRVEDHETLARAIDEIVFGTLLTNGPDGPRASHLPLLLDRHGGGPGTLCGHLARANPHVQSLADEPALVIFQGPAHYVTPSWYASKAQTGKVVPTWNYVVVHARGTVRLRQEPEFLRSVVESLTDRMEASRPEPWGVDDAPAEFTDALLRQIVGVEIPLTSLEGKFKLGQNRPAADRASLAAGLETELPEVWRALGRLPAGPDEPA